MKRFIDWQRLHEWLQYRIKKQEKIIEKAARSWQRFDVGGWLNRPILWAFYGAAMVVLLWVCLWPAQAQAAPHSVTLNWTASTDGGVVTVYRAAGACSSSSVFASITTGVTANTFTDSTVSVGAFCYQVTTVVNGLESNPSNQVTVRILPQAPTGLTGAAQ